MFLLQNVATERFSVKECVVNIVCFSISLFELLLQFLKWLKSDDFSLQYTRDRQHNCWNIPDIGIITADNDEEELRKYFAKYVRNFMLIMKKEKQRWRNLLVT